jgi:hypothetical protein
MLYQGQTSFTFSLPDVIDNKMTSDSEEEDESDESISDNDEDSDSDSARAPSIAVNQLYRSGENE